MSKQQEIKERLDRILGIVVEQYIRSSIPVSSALIAEGYRLDLSPATIRHILAELEEVGYLTHPHTSAGRVPTEAGYRYYVDHLMNEIQLLEEEKERVQLEYKKQVQELEGLLERTSQLVADLTHYTSIICLDGSQRKIFCRGTSFVAGYPEFQDINKIRDLLQILEEKERLLEIIDRSLQKRIEFYIGHEIACREVESCSLAISRFETERGTSGRIAVLGPTRMDYERVVSTLEYVSHLMSRVL